MKNLLPIFMAVLLMPAVARADLISYDFEWTGTGGYSMLGMFTFDDMDAGDGAIRDDEVVSLFFEGFLNGVSIGANNTAHLLDGFNFNFNTLTGQFFLGGNSAGDEGQRWNAGGMGLGYGAGTIASGLSLDGQNLGGLPNPNNLTASIQQVPGPSTLALLGLGLFGMGLARRKKI